MPDWFWWTLAICLVWIGFVFAVAALLGRLNKAQPDPYGEDGDE